MIDGLSENDRKVYEDAYRRSKEGMESSAIFLQIFSEGIEKAWLPCLQFGLAIMLDKPIFFVVPNGSNLPENLKRVAQGIEYYDREIPNDIQRATERLLLGPAAKYVYVNMDR